MKSKLAVWTLCFHAGFLALACTSFSVLGWIWGSYAWTWNYFQYSYKNGWGNPYQSDYSPAVVLTYIVAYLAGLVGHSLAWRRIPNGWTGLAAALSALGLISFLIEGSHWLWSHHLSFVVICPAASLLLMGVVIVQLGGVAGRPTELSASPDGGLAKRLDDSGVAHR